MSRNPIRGRLRRSLHGITAQRQLARRAAGPPARLLARLRLLLPMLLLLLPTLIVANHPSPLPDTITTPNAGYSVRYTDDNPPPATDMNYLPGTQAQNMANALDNSNAPSTGNPNGYHGGYVGLGFLAPNFAGAASTVFAFNCAPGSPHDPNDCDSGNAPADRINMPTTGYLTASESCIRRVIGHEVFHHVQFAYITFGKWLQWGREPVEGTARMMEDKAYADLDSNACPGYRGEANNYLGDTNRSMWSLSYTTALFWNYLTEQLGSTATEPQRGVDFMTAFWQNAQANNATPDLIATLRQTIAQFDNSITLEQLFHNFTVANYTKGLNLTALDEPLKFRYVDENDGTGQTYNAVTRSWSGTVLPTRSAAGSVVRWGARYYEATLSPDCQSRMVVGFLSDGDTAAYSLAAVKGTNQVDRIYQGVQGRFARAFMQRTGSPYTRLAAVVAGLNDPASYSYTFDCGQAGLNIVRPTAGYRAYVGEGSAPDRFLIRLNVTGPASLGQPSVEGLDPSDFQVHVGAETAANLAPVVSGAYVQGQYWLVAQAPVKASNGDYELRVKLADSIVDVEESAVRYEKLILDQVLVIDRSGSMLSPAGAPKLDAAKNAAGLFVDSARSQDKLGVVSFGGNNSEPNDDATLEWQLKDVTAGNRTAAHTEITGLSTTPAVMTSIGDGMKKAADEFPIRGSTLGEDWIVLLSDGMENEALHWAAVRPAIQAAGIKVHAIALGPLTDQALLQSIASSTGGDYYYVDVGPGGMLRPAGASSSPMLPNRLADAYAAVSERIQGHERIWEAAGTVAAGDSVEHTITVGEGGISDGLFSFNWSDSTEQLGVSIRRPDGTVVTNGVAGAQVLSSSTHYVARVGSVVAGTWTITLQGQSGTPDYLGLLSGRNQQGAQLEVFFGQYHGDVGLLAQNGLFMRGLPMPILASLADSAGPVRGAEVVATIEHPDGSTLRLPLLDDGSHGDGNANDGIYGNLYTRTTEYSLSGQADDPSSSRRGSYNVHLQASGSDNVGAAFQRIRSGSFQIFEGIGREQKSFDSDNDGMPDRYEALHPCLKPSVPDADGDPDADGLTNLEEFKLGSDPCHPDSDRGGESDLSEAQAGRNIFDPRDDALPQPMHVEVVDWVAEHMPKPDLRANANLIRYPVNPAYAKIRLLRSTSPSGPFVEVAVFDARANDGLYRDEGLTNNTTYYYQIQGVDLNGNLSAPSHVFQGTPRADPFAPIGNIIINNHRVFTSQLTRVLRLSATPDTSQMLISNSPTFTGASWETFAPTKTWTLQPAPSGAADVYARFRDAAGNESLVYHDEVIVRPLGSLGAIRGRLTLMLARKSQASNAGIFVAPANSGVAAPVFTDDAGNFLLDELPPGTYDLILEYSGFATRRINGVVVEAGSTTDLGSMELDQQRTYVPIVRR